VCEPGSESATLLSSLLSSTKKAKMVLRLRGPLADDPTVRVLHSLLLGLLIWTILEISAVPFLVRKLVGPLFLIAQALVCIISLVLVRRGRARISSLTYLTGSWVLNTITLALSGGLHSPLVALGITLPISAAWLLGYRAMLWATAGYFGSCLLMALLEIAGLGPWSYFPLPPVMALAQLVKAAVIGVVPVAQTLKILTERLTQSQSDQEMLRESEARFRNMADTAPVMIWVSDANKLCTFFNKPWLDFAGRTIGQEWGNGWVNGVHPDDLDRCFATYSRAFDARQNFQMEYRLRRADGEYRSVLDNGVPRFGPGGSFAGYIGSAIDVTDLKRAQEEILARQKLESLSLLTRGIAHDFNNLLSTIMAQAELADMNLGEGSSPGEEIRQIKTVATRASEIVRELMVYSGQERGHLQGVNLSGLIEEMLELLKSSISKRASLQMDLCRDLPAVWCNTTQIRQMVMNLVINAAQALGDKEGVIQVRTLRVAKAGDVTPGDNVDSQGDSVRLEISDTGCGMTDEEKAKIFDPFFTTKSEGHGLGLAVVHGIVRSHGGAINVISTLGKGTTFTVLLPCPAGLAEIASPATFEHGAAPVQIGMAKVVS